MTTTTEGVDHNPWPCVPHRQGETCQQAMDRVRSVMGRERGPGLFSPAETKDSRVVVPGVKE
jgi:hypothetical protein